jgi:predicted pyridoxine 5'-phosphate oxidase superfamily flavin-nucleotide-binding protein
LIYFSKFITKGKTMAKITQECKEVLDKTEWLAIGTAGEKGVHLVGTWGSYIQSLGIEEEKFYIPVGGFNQTEQNLQNNAQIEILCASKDVQGSHGPGQGIRINGKGKIETSGSKALQTKELFPWARGVLIFEVKKITVLL